jgi:hypothetical protein
MKDLARLVARYSEVLYKVVWLDLERLLREAFEGIGFAAELTLPSKDEGLTYA